MGVWGIGLYSGDFAADLRAAAIAVCRLPFNGDRLLDILIGTEPSAANNDKDEDHTTFWLVVADQFAKRGIPCDRAQQTALRIIDNGQDIELLQGLGMEPHLLRKRQAMLVELHSRITVDPSDGVKKRVVLKKPQAFLMNAGDVFVYPFIQHLKDIASTVTLPPRNVFPTGTTMDGVRWSSFKRRSRARDHSRQCLIQARGKHPVREPGREASPFYSPLLAPDKICGT